MSEPPELVDLSVIFPSLYIDLKYATVNNITGAPIYRETCCLLHTEAVTALAKSINIAQLAGLQLVVYDVYRLQQAQAILWNACPDPQYAVDVVTDSNYSRGTVIDATLMDDRGYLFDMGTGFNKTYDRSHTWHPPVSPAAWRNRLLLNATMFGGGFAGINSEWRHFELPDAVRYSLLGNQIDCYTVMPITTQHLP